MSERLSDAQPEPASRRIAIVATTRNRRDSLRRTLRAALAQTGTALPIGVVVMDDASTDGTDAMLREEFPSVRSIRAESPVGYIAARNRAARDLTEFTHLIYLDDDSWPVARDAAARALETFAAHPDAAVLAFEIFAPYHLPLPPAAERDGAETATFIGCGFAVDRERFLALGGFEEGFEFYGEETEFAMRTVDSAWTCRFAARVGVYHAIESAGRDGRRIFRRALANSLLTYALREPFPECVAHSLLTSARFLAAAARRKDGLRDWVGATADFAARAWKMRSRRRPISRSALRRFRGLVRDWARWFRGREGSPEARLDPGPPGATAGRSGAMD